jgi:hypothetical protein
MTDPVQTTPAADPSAPAAVTTPTTPDPTTTPVAAAPAVKSIIPEEPAADPTPEPTPDPKPDDGPEWFFADGVKGVGKMPEWYKADKYKTLSAQAEAYAHLEKRLGAFVGAPKDGKYELPPPPEGVDGTFDAEHPLFATFTGWAAENQVSQKAYNDLLGMFAQYEAAQTPNMSDVKAELGADADARINRVSVWAKANLSGDEFNAFRSAMSDRNAAQVFRAVEAVVAKTRQPAVPKPGDGGDSVIKGGLEAIAEMQAKVDPATGKRFYETDAKYRAMVEKKRVEYFEAQNA